MEYTQKTDNPEWIDSKNPVELDGFGFIEFATTSSTEIVDVFTKFGFVVTGRHCSKDILLLEQGKLKFIVNAEAKTDAASFRELHNAGICGMCFRVQDSEFALREAIKKGAEAVSCKDYGLPAVKGVGNSKIYLVDRQTAEDFFSSFFQPTGATPQAKPYLTSIDHITQNVYRGNMAAWAKFYYDVFNFQEIRCFDIKGRKTGLCSKALISPCGKIRLPLNESQDDRSQIAEFLEQHNGEGIQHLALGCDDIYTAVNWIEQQGVAFQDTPDTYYDALAKRVPHHQEDLAALRRLKILIDGNEREEGILLQIFTKEITGSVFFELIERKGNAGFGEGNFQALFESIELDQIRRGVLSVVDNFSVLTSEELALYVNPALIQVAVGAEKSGIEVVRFPSEHSWFELLDRFSTTDIEAVGLSAFSLLLHRYTGQEQFKLGHDRIGEVSERLNLVCNLTAKSSFGDLLESARQLYKDRSGRETGRSAKLHSDIGYSLAYFESGIPEGEIAALIREHLAQSKMCLMLDSSSAILAYDRALFDDNFALDFVRHFDILLGNIRGNFDRSLEFASLTDRTDRSRQEDVWQSQTSDYGELSIYHYFERYAEESPDAVAVTFGDRQMSYGELNLCANQLAHYLLEQNVRPQDCVGVFVDPGTEIPIAILALHKINAVYVPIDPEYPLGRIRAVVDQVAPSVIICASERQSEINDNFEVETIDLTNLDLSTCDRSNLNYPCPPESISHLFFTSGTTGIPKGVVSDHSNLIQYIFSAREKYRFGAEDSFLAAARSTFSISLLMLLLPLACGGRVNIITFEQLLEPKLLAEAIESVNFVHLSPSVLKTLLDFVQQDSQNWSRFDRVRHISSGGDLIPADLLNRLNRVFTRAEVYAIYGSSEVSCMGCTYLVPKELEITKTLVGKPFSNVKVRVLDRYRRAVPFGVKGEIYFSGRGITPGYLNLPHKTKTQYIWFDGERFYRTGDVGCMTPQGNLQIFGRDDNQVQIRGMRIELAEIESSLNLHPAIDGCITIAKENDLGDKQLIAYLIATESVTPRELRSFLQPTLPQYMIPARFMFVERFPLNLNGKVDRSVLASLNYWQEQLAEIPSLLELPTDRSRAAIPTYRKGVESFKLSSDSLAKLQAIARESEATLFTILLTLFAALLARYSSSEDIVIGSPIVKRDRRKMEPQINTLVLRTDLTAEPSFRELLQKVRQTTLDAYAHSEIQFDELVKILQPEPSSHYSALSQVMFVWQNQMKRATPASDSDLDRLVAQSDLTLSLETTATVARGFWQYNSDLFDATTIERLNGHFQTLLEGAIANPEQSVTQLPLLTPAERQQLLVEWNDTATEYPRDKCIHQLFESQVERSPDAVAVVFEDRQLTYQELNDRANQLARHLQQLGVGPEVFVGICVERSLEMVVGLLGILKAGGCYVPLDPAYPQERVKYVLNNSQVEILITEQTLREQFLERDVRLVWIDTDWGVIAREETSNLDSGVVAENLAYIIYTSGSTGNPKGVQIGHRSTVNFLNSMRHEPGLSARDILLAVTTISFDIAVLELYLPLIVGARVVIASRETAIDGARLAALLDRTNATVMQATPTTWKMLLAAQWQENRQFKMLCGGEAMSNELAEQLLSKGDSLWNMYGPTETTVWSAACKIEPGMEQIPIAGPIANTQIYILDSHLQPVPIGIPGEVYLGGDGLAKGYLNRPETTQERFIKNPFSDREAAQIYKTGDLARYRPNGTLEYLGRIDYQVKIRGFRIELGEIESVLARHPAIRETVVLAREDVLGDKRLVAYLIAREEQPTSSHLRSFVGENLPSYMVPSAFIFLDAMPLTPNGKVDRRALPAPDRSNIRLDAESEYVPPRNPIESQLAEIWSELLGTTRTSVNDNFFELGGHSLLATQVISRCRQAFSVEIPLQSLFKHPTVATLAQTIAQSQNQGTELSQYQPILSRAKSDRLPLSFAQQRLWFLDQLEPNSSAYNIPNAARIEGQLDVKALQQALDAIVVRHQVIRTNYYSQEGSPFQVVAAPSTVELPTIDLQQYGSVEQEAHLQKLLQQESQKPFDLASDLMLRTCLLQLAPQRYILLLVMHHIASDVWSLDILWSELTQLYQAFTNHQANPLATLPIQYADYAAWQREWLTGEVLERQLDYWVKQLAGANPILELPTDRPRPAVQSYRGASQPFSLSQNLTQQLNQLCRQQGVTLYMVLLAAFQTLLYRYSGQQDVVVGSPIAGRNRAEIEELIGFFVNTLVLRTDLSGEPSFNELLQRVRSVTLDAYEHQDLPFDKLVDELQIERSLSYNPLFQVMFVLQNQVSQVKEISDLAIAPLSIEQITAKFDLTLVVEETPEGLTGFWQYNSDLFERATVERLNGHLQILLEGAIANPEQSIARLPLLTAPERQQLLVEWNETETEYPRDKCIHQLFEAQVERSPDAVAVVFEDRELTYQELNERANQLAHHLQQLGVGPEVLVGICFERSLEMVVGLLGVLKAGGAYVPLDPKYPPERLNYIVSDSEIKLLLTRSALLETLSCASNQVFCLDTDWEIVEHQPQHNLDCSSAADNLAYIIYTSGSTGKPKGVLIEHQGLCNLAREHVRLFAVRPNSRVLQFASASFDASVSEIFMALTCGASLVMATGARLMPGEDLTQTLLNYQITHVTIAPSALAALPLKKFPDLGQIIVAGEACPLQLMNQWSVGRRFINAYGPTETTVCATVAQIDEGSERVTIGRPIANAQIYILDAHLQPVPIGVAGEMYIGGAGVARGYLNREQLTAERFINNPLIDGSQDKLYRTGDLARYLVNGEIEYLGRIDLQVKIRGFRIEPGEIESVLARHPALRETAVIAREDVPGDKRLVAYFIAQGEQPTGSELRAFIGESLPNYMVPSAFVCLDAMPLTPNGKVDRRALPAPDTSNISSDADFIPPSNPTEELLVTIWREVLGTDRIGIDDNFFELGGHSLLATQVISRCRQAFSVQVALQSLFKNPTIATLARTITQFQSQEGWSAYQTMPPEAKVKGDRTLLSFQQQRLWFLDRLEPNSSFYNMPGAVKLGGKLNITALQQALDAMVVRHEVIRTNYRSENGNPFQVVAPPASVELSIIDLQQYDATEQEEQVQKLLQQESQKPFNLESDLMLRACLLQLAPQEHLLLLVMHHIATDGWSMGILWQELAQMYRTFDCGQPNSLESLPIQYADYAVWQRQRLSGEALERQLDYWVEQLTGAEPVLELPLDRPRPPVQTYRGASQSITLSQSTSDRLQRLCRREEVTLYMTLLAAFQTLLYRYSGQSDIVVGSPFAGRNRAEIEKLIGFFVNTVVLRSDLSGNARFTELLQQVRSTVLDAYDRQDVPFEKIVDALRLERDTSRNPLFQVWFNLLNVEDVELKLPGIEAEFISTDEVASKFDITLYVKEQQDGIELELVYNADLFDLERMVEMLEQYRHLLDRLLENPEIRIDDLSTVTPKAQLLLPNPRQKLPRTGTESVRDKFTRQAQKVPQHLALVDVGDSWTYAELDERANRLANYLIANGVKQQDIVAVYGQRSASLVWAILGILKAGAAFVILDSAYPASRSIECLQVAQPSAWLQTADELPTELQEYLDTLACNCRLRLPQAAKAKAAVDDLLQDCDPRTPEISVEPDSLAYVAFTSGSTGKPKGILGTHRPLSHFIDWHRQTFALEQLDRFGLLAGLSHDPLLRDIFTPLSLGATLYIPEQQDIYTPAKLANWMQHQQISIAHLTPAMAQLLTADKTISTPDLRYVFFGGDLLTAKDVSNLAVFAPAATCVNFYGATETPQAMGYFVLPPAGDRLLQRETIPVGRGIEGVQLLVLNAKQQLAGIGELAEIYIRTPYLTQGYIGSEQLTNEKFIINPFTGDPDDRLYKTGDLGRYLPNGELEFLGRSDLQVKIRGFRIEPGEIEAVLAQHPDLSETVVTAREDVPGDKRLVAYVVAHGKQPNSNDLRSFVRRHLPNYMVPAAFVWLDTMPLTPNGKVDRRALPAPDRNLPDSSSTAVPQDQLESNLIQIWEEVLGVRSIGVEDNFFDLGGNSLQAVTLFAQIEKQFGKQLPLATLFQSGTVAEIARIVRQENWLAPWESLVPIQPQGDKPPLFYIHGGGGNLLVYRDLAYSLGYDQPVYGLQPRGLDGNYVPFTRLEDMAAYYLTQIRQLQPEGPYFLAGLSSGGTTAWEIAQRLKAQGQEVALLALFDTSGPDNYRLLPPVSRLLSVCRWIGWDFQRKLSSLPQKFTSKFKQLGTKQASVKILEKFGIVEKASNEDRKVNREKMQRILAQEFAKYQTHADSISSFERSINSLSISLLKRFARGLYVETFVRALSDNKNKTIDDDSEISETLLQVQAANIAASRNYVPTPYSDEVILFRASDRPPGFYFDPKLGWGELAVGGMKIYEIPGDHTSIMQSTVLAKRLKDCLDKAQAD